ncbi:MAG: ATP-binding cassette domain-containing protein [Phycisphaerales bacterium]
MSDLALDLQHVAKTYRGKVRALQGIEMAVARGEVFGLLGPNGAGKSTLVKILMTVISPSQCQGTMLGKPVGHKPTLSDVGYLPEHHRFPPYLKGGQVLDFFGAMGNVPRRERRRRAAELLEVVGIADWAKKKVGGYSKGMRQRLGIAQALMNDPKLVVLDEPTDGVDPVGRRDIRDIVARLRDEQRTIFINSHLLSELEMVCDRVAILVQGRVRQQGTLDELTEGQHRYELEIVPPQGDASDALDVLRGALPGEVTEQEPPKLPAGTSGTPPVRAEPNAPPFAKRIGFLGTLADGTRVEIERMTLRISTSDPKAVEPVIDRLRARGVTIRSLQQRRPSLEDLFMQAVTDPETGMALKPGAERKTKGAR